MSDQKILELFKNGNRDKAFRKLYYLYPRIEKLILSKGGKKEDALDVFQEALIILNRNLEKSDFNLTSSFTPICILSLDLFGKIPRSNTQNKELHSFSSEEVELFHSVIEEKKYRIAEQAFSELGKRCQQLLQLFYHRAMSFKEIANVMQFSSEKVAKNQKYKCLTKAKDIYQKTINTVQS